MVKNSLNYVLLNSSLAAENSCHYASMIYFKWTQVSLRCSEVKGIPKIILEKWYDKMKWNGDFFPYSISTVAAICLKINQNTALYVKKGYKICKFRLTKCKSRQVLTCHLIIMYYPVCLLYISTLKVSGLKDWGQIVIAHADIPLIQVDLQTVAC